MTWILLVGYTLLLGTADTMFSRQRMSMVRGIAYFTLMAAAFCLCAASHLQWKLTNPVDVLARLLRLE